MKKAEIIQEAERYAREQGWRIENYEVTSVKSKGGTHVVSFQGKSGQEGDHFTVVLDAATGRATRLVPGR
jgi:hypothetical protein